MGRPAASANSLAVGVDVHLVMVPTPGGPVPTPLPHPFSGQFSSGLVSTVLIAGAPAAVQGSIAMNSAPHIAMPPGVAFQRPPSNQGTIQVGSATVKFGGKPAARLGDPVMTCNDPSDAPTSQVVASGTVLVGG
jgi:uncharacterized Zn-binding protein involved in type VI secretion